MISLVKPIVDLYIENHILVPHVNDAWFKYDR